MEPKIEPCGTADIWLQKMRVVFLKIGVIFANMKQSGNFALSKRTVKKCLYC